MARTSPADKLVQITTLMRAWKALRPQKRYSGMTLQQFASATKDSHAARAEIKRLQADLRSAIARRNAADAKVLGLRQLIVFAILGDPDDGPNSALYEALGYVPKRRNRTGKYRRKAAK